MDVPETRYTTTVDGVYIAYQVVGGGPFDLVCVPGCTSNLEAAWDLPPAVHIGARVAALAGPSEVLVSQTVKDLVAGSGLSFEDAGEHVLKGIPDRWRLYWVVA